MNATPLLSICIPTYNRSKYLDGLLDALAGQITKADLGGQIEIVISDNCSTDHTPRVVEKWATRHSFIRSTRTEWNIGGDSNQVGIVSLAAGKFVWLFGDDDRPRDNAVATVFSQLKPGVSQLFLNYRCMNRDGVCVSATRLHEGISDDITTVELVKRLGFIHPYSLMTSHVFDREQFLAADPVALLKVSPWYAVPTIMLMAFHNQKVTLVREPLVDFTMGNDRLPNELVFYVRVMGVLNTLRALEAAGAIDSDFLFGCYETGAGSPYILKHNHYFREELFWNLTEFIDYWALPGRADSQVLRSFIDRGPGFWDIRHRLKAYFLDDFEAYTRHQKPMIHYWKGKAWFPDFSLLLSSNDREECHDFDRLAGRWPEKFTHESILVSTISEEEGFYEHLNVFMAPYRLHRSPSSSLNSGFRKTLTPRVLVLDRADSAQNDELIALIDQWQSRSDAPAACLLFESMPEDGSGVPTGFLGLYFKREDLVFRGGFENGFEDWERTRLIADAALRLGSEAWALDGGRISPQALSRWYAAELPGWIRLHRRFWKGPCSEHGLNITLRGHLERLERDRRAAQKR